MTWVRYSIKWWIDEFIEGGLIFEVYLQFVLLCSCVGLSVSEDACKSLWLRVVFLYS